VRRTVWYSGRLREGSPTPPQHGADQQRLRRGVGGDRYVCHPRLRLRALLGAVVVHREGVHIRLCALDPGAALHDHPRKYIVPTLSYVVALALLCQPNIPLLSNNTNILLYLLIYPGGVHTRLVVRLQCLSLLVLTSVVIPFYGRIALYVW